MKFYNQEDYQKLVDNQFSDERLDEFYHIIEAKDAEIEELKSMK